MKVNNNNPARHAMKAVTTLFKSLKTSVFNNNYKKLVFLPVLLLAFLVSCKKEAKLIQPNEQQQETQQETQHLHTTSCGTTDYLQQQLVSDPALKTRMSSIEQDIQNHILSKSQLRTAAQAVTIPVVVHVVYNTAEQNVSDAQVQSQIDVLNEDFNRTNADAINTPACFQPYAAVSNIHFVLAKRDPNGNATNGITRTATANTSFSSNNYVKFNSYGGHDAWSTTQYLNIWVCNLGIGGYATYPGASASVDGVVVRYDCFGRVGTLLPSYNKGRTSTHEVSHWLNVYHIWGDGVCADDLVSDTPTQEKSNSSYPVFPYTSACSSNTNGDMFMNYMDYTADGARNMMTAGQVARMDATLNGPRASILTSLGGIAPSGSTTTITPTVCNIPGGLNVASITANGASLKWSSTGAASYNVRYKSTTSATWINVSSSSTAIAVSGLSSATNYEFQVASVCSGTASSAFSSSAMFVTGTATTITPTVCNIPTGLNVTKISKNSATLNWYSTGVASYSIRYKATTSAVWTTVSVSAISLAINGLTASTTYEFQVASVCSGTSVLNYSASKLFMTSTTRKLQRINI